MHRAAALLYFSLADRALWSKLNGLRTRAWHHAEARKYLTCIKDVAHRDASKNANEGGRRASEGQGRAKPVYQASHSWTFSKPVTSFPIGWFKPGAGGYKNNKSLRLFWCYAIQMSRTSFVACNVYTGLRSKINLVGIHNTLYGAWDNGGRPIVRRPVSQKAH